MQRKHVEAVRASASSTVGKAEEGATQGPSEEHEEPDEDDFQCAPCEAGGVTEPRRHPGNPTREEVDEHELSHCPFRSWCPIFVEAQGKEDLHYKGTKDEIANESPVVSMEYKEISEYDGSRVKVTMVVCRDKWTKSVATHAVKAKGSTECATRFVEFLDSFGYNEMVLKSDNEAAIKVLRDEVLAKRKRPTRPGSSVPMHPQTHLIVEKTVQDVMDQLRKMKMALERRLKAHIS